jgi:anti-sigma factor RsiW
MPFDRSAALRFALTRDRRLALWTDPRDGELAGLAEWHGRPAAHSGDAERARLAAVAHAAAPAELPGWAVRALAGIDGPCRFDRLVDAFRAAQGVPIEGERTQPIALAEQPPVSFETLAAYVDGRLDAAARAVVDRRLPEDPSLARALAELSALASRLAPVRPAPRPVPPPAPVPAAAAPPPSSPFGWLLAAAAVVIGGVALVLGWLWFGRERGASVPTVSAPAPTTVAETAVLDGGRRVVAIGEDRLEGLPGLSGNVARRVARALATGELPAAEGAARLGSRPVTGAATGPSAELVAPVATGIVAEAPRFVFRVAPEVRAVRVVVVDPADPTGTVFADSGELAAARGDWVPERALPRGRVLAWQLELRAGRQRNRLPAIVEEAPRFRLVPADEVAFAEREISAAHGSRLVAAVLYAELGAYEEARAAFAEVARENPGSAAVARLAAGLAAAARAAGSAGR